MSLTLNVTGLGHVTAKKNRHYGRTDGGVCIDRKQKEWIKRATALLRSQCVSAIPTSGGGISGAALRQFLTSSLPSDDNWKCIPVIVLTGEKCAKGMEGVEIVIEAL